MSFEIISKINEIEKKTGQSILPLLSEVPFGNVVTAFSVIPVQDLVDMVLSVPITKTVRGLQIINKEEIRGIVPDRLKIVLKYGNMETVSQLQEKFSTDIIISAVNGLSENHLKSLLMEDVFETMCHVIETYK